MEYLEDAQTPEKVAAVQDNNQEIPNADYTAGQLKTTNSVSNIFCDVKDPYAECRSFGMVAYLAPNYTT